MCAWILLLLAVLPFTAPFPTFDLAMLRGGSPAPAGGPPPATAPLLHAARTASAPAQAPYEESLKDDKSSCKDVILVATDASESLAVAAVAPRAIATAPVLPHRRHVTLRL